MLRLLFAAAVLTACGGSADPGATPLLPIDSGAIIDSSAIDSPPGDGKTCVDPVVGAVCSIGDPLCPGNEGGCCAGYVWGCVSGKWAKQGLGCPCVPEDTGIKSDALPTDAGPFACGSSSCVSGELCKVQESGIDGGSSFSSCSALPAGCEATPSCTCVKAKIPASCTVRECNDDGKGHVTVKCMGA